MVRDRYVNLERKSTNDHIWVHTKQHVCTSYEIQIWIYRYLTIMENESNFTVSLITKEAPEIQTFKRFENRKI